MQVVEYQSVVRVERGSWGADLGMGAVVLVMGLVNANVCVAKWADHNQFGYFALGWVGVAVFLVAVRILGWRARWFTVVALELVSAVGFYINSYFLAAITASC